MVNGTVWMLVSSSSVRDAPITFKMVDIDKIKSRHRHHDDAYDIIQEILDAPEESRHDIVCKWLDDFEERVVEWSRERPY